MISMPRMLCIGLIFLASTLEAKPWKSGEIVSQQSFLYGAFEARLQSSAGSAAVSSFYLMKDDSWIPGQAWQELDFEYMGKNGAKGFQTQIMTPGNPRQQHIEAHQSQAPLSDGFHVYRIEWTPDALRFFFDGKLLRQETDRKEYAKFLDRSQVEAMRLRLTLWAGFSSWSGILDPQNLPTPVKVDWIRAYGYNEAGRSFPLLWEDSFDAFDDRRWTKANWTFEYAVNDFEPSHVYTDAGQLHIYFSGE